MGFHWLTPSADILAQDGQAVGRGYADQATQTADTVMGHMGIRSVGRVLMICMGDSVRMLMPFNGFTAARGVCRTRRFAGSSGNDGWYEGAQHYCNNESP